MAEAKDKVYEVLPGKMYTGKHKVYHGADDAKGWTSQRFTGKEIFGDLDIALNGMKGQKRRGKDLPDVKPVIKLVTASKQKTEQKEDKK